MTYYSPEQPESWWVQLVKDNQAKPGANQFVRLAKTSAGRVKDIMADLVKKGYLMVEGKTGPGQRPWYRVTSFGHRFLEEQKQALLKLNRPDPEPVGKISDLLGQNRAVPAASDSGTTPDEPDIVRHDPKAIKAPVIPITPVPGARKASAKADFEAIFEKVLISVLMARYAHLVTAAEIMEELAKNGADYE